MFFSDIVDFTRTTETMEPEDMANLLNEYLTYMHVIIDEYGGTLARIEGDGLYVFLGAPASMDEKESAYKCVNMAIEMQLRMKELQSKWFERGIEHPFQIRCGINTGVATVGSYGSKLRSEYTAMGSQVNIAARLERECKSGRIIISHATWALIKNKINCQKIGTISVKGIPRDITIYDVLF